MFNLKTPTYQPLQTFEFLQQLEAAMVQAMVVYGFRIHERQRHMKSEVALLTDVNAIAKYPVGWRESK